MKLYNTLTRKAEEFKPLDKKQVKLFVCGPTVYDYSHIGHAKTYTQMDILARALDLSGYKVFYLQNITDIDDKIIVRAQEKGQSWKDLGSHYEAEYYKDMECLSNTSVTKYARATDFISNIIKQVQVLLDKGHAYKTDDGIYFEIATYADYGKLSGRQDVKENDAVTRVDQSDQKRGWNDFCLWKFSKPNEPVWDAPYGAGRPGWHIEDTAITEHFFGPQYDIHGGAVDLIFPHHEAEITQMEAASGKVPLVKYWVHSGFLNIDNTKMSKSLGNFFTIRDVLDKGYSPMAIRLLMLQSHYRSTINFSWDVLEAATNRLISLRALADLRHQANNKGIDCTELIASTKTAVQSAVQNDLNTPMALAELNQLETALDKCAISTHCQESFSDFIDWLDKLLGLGLGTSKDITAEQKRILEVRERARLVKDWDAADTARHKLVEQGIGIRGTEYGPIWYHT